MSWPWSELGLPGPADLRSIRQAYAQRLKTTRPEDDPAGFQRLHEAYQQACRMVRQKQRGQEESEGDRRPAEPGGKEVRPEIREILWPPREQSAPEPGAEEPEESEKPVEPKNPEQSERLENQEEPKKSERPEKRDAPEKADAQKQEGAQKQADAQKNPEETEHPQWDYERLFAEGEAEEQEIRRRRIQELREKNRARVAAREQEQRRRAADEEESWAAVMAAAHALELLMASNAPLPEWRRFLESSVFWNVRSNLDFVFALEDFLEQNPDLPQAVRQAVFAAYELEKGVRPEYYRLNRLLNVSRREKQAIRRRTSLWRRQWQGFPWRRRFATVFGVVFLGLMGLIAFWDLTGGIRASLGSLLAPESAWEEHALEWLEEDFGESFIRDGELFAPTADPERLFHAASYGEREEGRPGYETNYPHVLVRKALEEFAGERELPLSLRAYSGKPGDAPGSYLLGLPLTGAEDDIAALGKLVEELEGQAWYQVPERSGPATSAPVEYQLFLCHEELAFYDARSSDGFDAEEALALYAQAGPAYCSYILEHSGLADRHMGETPYMFLDQGRAEIDGGEFFWVSAADQQRGLSQVHYFLSTSGTTLFCLPQERLEGVTAAELYEGASTQIQLEGAGSVLVWDLMEAE